ncbi:hypothetical protein [Halomonas salina]|uniref:hypothetical protein n=1 Tax=Halomonas salina TaxID=42565 RepID=UPI0013647E84|nr:hypothetical protein [Halomonas salina]
MVWKNLWQKAHTEKLFSRFLILMASFFPRALSCLLRKMQQLPANEALYRLAPQK